MVSKDQRAERWAYRGEGLECLLSPPAVKCVVGILQIEADKDTFDAFSLFFFGIAILEQPHRLRGHDRRPCTTRTPALREP